MKGKKEKTKAREKRKELRICPDVSSETSASQYVFQNNRKVGQGKKQRENQTVNLPKSF